MKIDIQQFQKDFYGKVSPIQKSIPKVRLYEMDLSGLAARQEELVENDDFKAGFSKACLLNTTKDGLRSEGFWSGFYSTMIGDNWEAEGFALSNAVGSTNSIMQFLPGSCTNAAAAFIADIASAQLGKTYDVVLLNGSKTSNAKAEQLALDAVEAANKIGRKVWFISQGMAARSFSVPAIDTVLLTYDAGDLGATLQKLSRALTAGQIEKIGHVVSIAVDPNREDKIASIILDAAAKAAEKNETDLKDELKRAYATFPLFSVDRDGCKLPISEDDYIERAMRLDAAMALTVSRSTLYTIDDATAADLADQIINKMSRESRAGKKEAGTKGRGHIDQNRAVSTTEKNDHEKDVNLIAKQLDAFVHNLHYIRYFTLEDHPQISSILTEADADEQAKSDFVAAAGMTPGTVRQAIEAGLLKAQWIDACLLKIAVDS